MMSLMDSKDVYLFLCFDCFSDVLAYGPVSKEKVLLIARFINACDAVQIRLASEKCNIVSLCVVIFRVYDDGDDVVILILLAVVSLCKRFKDKVLELRDPLLGVAPLLAAVRKVQVSTKRLTALHPDCLQLCLLAKCYKAGFSILSDDILEVDQPREFYLYCYYGYASLPSFVLDSYVNIPEVTYRFHFCQGNDMHWVEEIPESIGASLQCNAFCLLFHVFKPSWTFALV